jgi:uncharacterized protein (UPF0276 family)
MPEDSFRQAAYPLFEAGQVDLLEWSFDTGWPVAQLPDWMQGLLQFYGQRGQLLGHGVTFSLLSGRWTDRHQQWLRSLREETARYRYRHISEHYGFMTAGNYQQGAPLPVLKTAETIRLGQDRLRHFAQAAGCPVGLENLAFAFGPRDVLDQGSFLEALLEPVDGFLLLDLHNLYCQSVNFHIPWIELIARYPLRRVRELHLSGGSWFSEDSSRPPLRRDTHDGAVPDELLAMLPVVLEKAAAVEAVIFEQLSHSLQTADSQKQFQADYRKIRAIVHGN